MRRTVTSVAQTLTVPCPPCWHLQLAGDEELGGLQAQDSIDSTGGEDGQDDSKVADQLPHLQMEMERVWPRLAGMGSAPGAALRCSTKSHPHISGTGGHVTGVAERCSPPQGSSGCS